MDFVVIDTEGSPTLSEIAVLDSQGKLIYEAFAADHPNNQSTWLKLKPLKQIAQEIALLARGKRVVCHYAKHDMEVLKFSFRKAKVPWSGFAVACTWELAKQKWPQLDSYSLEHLSKFLHLKVNGKLFHSAQAHTSRYDAEFTHQLYLKILEHSPPSTMPPQLPQLQDKPNPFSSSRVDTPFQDHLDFSAVYHAEFELLKSILDDIKADSNRQSKGALVIGEAGSGKTHLIMRMAKELLRTNRLLFIRQPNNATAVLHHTYSRILESFAENVKGSDRTQLELLLANSFVKILSSSEKVTSSQKGRAILAVLQNNALSLYSRLGNEGTQRHREVWQYIEQHITEWWSRHYTAAGYSATILKGIIKFCSYSDPKKKDLVRRWLAASELEDEQVKSVDLENWQEDISREEFALEAIAVFGRLSTLDEPLIIVFDQLEGLGLAHNEPILESFGTVLKEILTHVPNSLIILNLFPDRWQQFKQFFDGSVVDRVSEYVVQLKQPKADDLKKLLAFKAKSVELQLNTLFNQTELNDIINQSSIRAVLNRAAAYFRYKSKNIPVPLDDSSIKDRTSLESRVEQLEQILSQIAALTQPYRELVGTQPAKPSVPPIDEKNSEETAVHEYLQEKKAKLTEGYDKPTIINDANEIGKLHTILEAFKQRQELEIDLLHLGKSKLPDHFNIKTPSQELVIGFLNAGGNAFTSKIKNFNQLVTFYPQTKFRLIRDAREPQITGAVGKAEIEKLNHSPNGQFFVMDQEDRVNFDLIYNLIIDTQEKDLEVDLAIALDVLTSYLSDYWLIAALS